MKTNVHLLDKAKAAGDSLENFLGALRVKGSNPEGAYLPCSQGITEAGRDIRLGFSCFALKTAYTIGLWQTMSPARKEAWADFIKGFQSTSATPIEGMPTASGAFIDDALITALLPPLPPSPGWQKQLRRLLSGHLPEKGPQRELDTATRNRIDSIILAETKQAIATLSQMGAEPAHPYTNIPIEPEAIRQRLDQLDWSAPWGAGGQASALITLLAAQEQAFRSLGTPIDDALSLAATYLANLLDPETGTYFKGERPDHGQLVNGAMKVLTALHWLDIPPHLPEKLIDFTLSAPPRPEGCHVVDSVYVLYQCAAQTDHRRQAIAEFAAEILEMIFAHQCADGGFSYGVGKSQTHYYGAHFGQGMTCGDIHGTCLLSWAVAMCLALLEADDDKTGRAWHVITP